MAIAADMRFGHYHVLAPLGAGGMGEVWRARDTRLNREVAIKVLPREYSADADHLRRFEQEALAVSALNHPNILTIYDIGTHEGAPFIVAELLEGEELRAQLEPGALPVRRALEYAQQITQGLAAAHEKGIVHRDLKPENLFVTKDGRVKILDFGLAKLKPQQVGAVDIDAPTQKKITDPGTVLGTVGYMSPEQVRGQEADTRADIFSFGVILYEMLSGRRTFSGDSAIEVMNAILKEDPPELTATNTRVPQGLERLIRRCLEKKPEHRFHSAHDLGYALEALSSLSLNQGLDTAKVMSAPSAEISPARTTSGARIILGEIKRHKFAALIALLLMIVAAVGLGLYLRGQKTEVAIDSIAVLPFANQNRAEETEYLADGLTESIINNLARLPDLRVIARNSVFRFKGKEADLLGAGQALGVRAVVVGRVLQRGENLMVSAELVDVRENKQLWGQQYNRKLADVFAVQEDIAKEISEKLRVKLSGAERQQLAKRPTENLKAFGYYMQGRAYFHRSTREDNLTAIRYYEKAIEEDRNYALAYAGLAGTYLVLGSRGQIAPIESRRKGEENARKALALDDNLAEGHAVRGQVYIEFSPSNFSLGDREQRRAIELSPNLAIAHLYLAISLVRQGRIDESLAEYMKARELDPLSSITVRDLALPYYLKRDYARALELLRQANELGPAFSTTFEIGVYIQNRLFNEALAELEKAKRERKDDPILIYDTGMVYAARGERAEALRIIKELETMSGASMSQAHWIAKIYATLNEKEMAFSWLERGLVAGAIGAFYKDEPVWDPIRSDPRFGDLLRRMGVPQ